MNEEYQEKSSRGLINLLLIIAIVGGIIAMMWKVGIFGKSAEDVEITTIEEVIATATDEDFSITKSEWTTMQKQLKPLQNEVKTLQTEVRTLKERKSTAPYSTTVTSPAKTSTATSSEKTTATTLPEATTNPNAMTLEKYSHDGGRYEAALSFKNNTNQTIKSFKGRIIYLDMKGNMLDYVDINQSISIEPGYVKGVELKGYGWDKDYSYYQSEASYLHPERKYQVKFELKSYSVK